MHIWDGAIRGQKGLEVLLQEKDLEEGPGVFQEEDEQGIAALWRVEEGAYQEEDRQEGNDEEDFCKEEGAVQEDSTGEEGFHDQKGHEKDHEEGAGEEDRQVIFKRIRPSEEREED